MMGGWLDDDVLERVQRLVPIAERLGITMAQLALAWVLREANVASAIVGASRPEQVRRQRLRLGHRARRGRPCARSTTRSAAASGDLAPRSNTWRMAPEDSEAEPPTLARPAAPRRRPAPAPTRPARAAERSRSWSPPASASPTPLLTQAVFDEALFPSGGDPTAAARDPRRGHDHHPGVVGSSASGRPTSRPCSASA